jgi:Spy/CpxP family protein refolding chaperone
MTSRTRIAVAAALAFATVFAFATFLPLAAVAARRPAAPLPGSFLERAAVRLELTASQREEIRAIVTARQPELAAEIKSIRTARESLWTAIHADAADPAVIRGAAAAVGRAEGELAVTRAEIVGDVREVLTAEQEEELADMLAEVRLLVESLVARLREHADLALAG